MAQQSQAAVKSVPRSWMAVARHDRHMLWLLAVVGDVRGPPPGHEHSMIWLEMRVCTLAKSKKGMRNLCVNLVSLVIALP